MKIMIPKFSEEKLTAANSRVSSSSGNPTDIKANASDGPESPTDKLSLTIALEPENLSGENADWWVAQYISGSTTDDGWYYYDLNHSAFVFAGSSASELIVTHQGSLFDLASYWVLDTSISNLSTGTHTFYFAVDMNMNGVLDLEQIYYDSVEVNITSSFSIITPYVNESDIRSVWLFDYNSHLGLDFQTSANLKPFQAVSSGIIKTIQLVQVNTNWAVDIEIEHNSNYSSLYVFEPMTAIDGENQLANIVVSKDQVVSQGEVIGYLYAPNAEAHVHFGLFKYTSEGGDPLVCPESYFTSQAKDSVLTLIQKEYPDKNICN